MPKPTTTWSKNPAKDTPAVPYSDSSVPYNSSTTHFSGVDTSLAEDGKETTAWVRPTKQTTDWRANPDFPSGYVYDRVGVTYDTIYNVYDGTIESSPSPKERTAWSTA